MQANKLNSQHFQLILFCPLVKNGLKMFANAENVFKLLPVFCFFITASFALPEQSLQLQVSQAKLPTIRDGTAAFYDGDDTIYLFGDGDEETQDILKFSISNDSISIIGQSPESITAYGTFQAPGVDSVIYVAGQGSGGLIYAFDTVSYATQVVAGPGPPDGFYMVMRGIAQLDRSSVHFFGGFNTPFEHIKMDLPSMSYTRNQTFLYPISFWASTAVPDPATGSIYIFGNITEKYGDSVMHVGKFDAATEQVSISYARVEAVFAYEIAIHNAVSDGKGNIFIVGNEGFRENKEVIFQYKIATNEFKAWNVRYLEGVDDLGLQSVGLAYVEKLNRLYIFGGNSGNSGFPYPREREEIWFIDLDQINE